MDSSVLEGIKSFFSTSNSNEKKKELVDPYVEFTFAGIKVVLCFFHNLINSINEVQIIYQIRSKICYNEASPVWNQELRLNFKVNYLFYLFNTYF